MKVSKEDLKKEINELVENDDNKIKLLEDVEDSFVETTEDEAEKVDKTEYDDVVSKYEELKTKYKERFLDGDKKEDDKKEDEEKKDEELEEEKVIDVKEI